MGSEKWTTESIAGLAGNVFVVTGGNSGLGYESVKVFAMKGGEVVLASRSEERGEQARRKILERVAGGKIRVMQLDLGDLGSVRRFAGEFKKSYKRLDVLVNNAGLMWTSYFRTKDGFEGQFGTNHLGHFALTGLLMDVLLKTPGSRVVTVSSGSHTSGKMDFENLQFENGRGYSPGRAYSRSKLANLLFTYELQRKLKSSGKDAIAVAANPGFTFTNLGIGLKRKFPAKLLYPVFKLLAKDQAKGALPQIRASVDPNVQGGEYYGPGEKGKRKGYPVPVQSSEASRDRHDAEKLWEISETLTGVKYRL